MLSVLIPTYNFDCTDLVMTLSSQLSADDEIVVGDDMSHVPAVVKAIDALEGMERVRVVRAATNMGAAGMRNMLCREAKGEWLLYVDCDTIVMDKHFVERYKQEAYNGVVCGIIRHSDVCPSPNKTLRWKYERTYEKKNSTQQSNMQPHQHFRTSHFLTSKSIMLQVPFDEKIKRSGYEDLLFGRQLKERGVEVRHTNIEAYNGDIEDNSSFLQKTHGHLNTLWQMQDELQGYSTLLNLHARIKRLHMLWAVKAMFKLTGSIIRRNLLGNNPSIRLFQFYKLGYFASLPRKEQTLQSK